MCTTPYAGPLLPAWGSKCGLSDFQASATSPRGLGFAIGPARGVLLNVVVMLWRVVHAACVVATILWKVAKPCSGKGMGDLWYCCGRYEVSRSTLTKVFTRIGDVGA
jgi:hypothetical protein